MLESTNPFNDPSIRDAILKKEGMVSNQEDVMDEYETLNPNVSSDSGEINFQGLIASTPKIPKVAKNLILDAGALAKQERDEKAKELTYSLSNIFSQYNKEFNTDLSIDFNNLSATLINVSDPESRKVLELYVSEVFKSIRPVLLLHLIQKLTLAIDYCTDTSRLLDSSSFTPQDVFIIVDKLISYVDQLNELCKEVVIPDSDKILKKMAEEKGEVSLDSEDSKRVVEDFMKLFLKDNNK